MAEGKKDRLTIYILIAIVAAIVMALAVPKFAMKFAVGGEIFLDLLKMLVVPLVVTSVMSGIFGMGDVRRLGKPGGLTILYYICTTFLAVFVGLVVVNIIRPGVGTIEDPQAVMRKAKGEEELKREENQAKLRKHIAESADMTESEVAKVLKDVPDPEPKAKDISTVVHNMVTMFFTDNLIKSAVEMDLLPLIVFSIAFAALLTTMGERVVTITLLVEQIYQALMTFILLLMKISPFGIFCLVTARFGEAAATGTFFEMLQQISMYMLTVLVGLAVHAFGTLPLIYWLVTKKNPYVFMRQMSQAILTAFSTASSSATLPVTMETCVDNAGVKQESAEFVLPLGATINMDGTALYEAAAAIFIAQVYAATDPSFDFGIAQQIVVAFTATLAAIGAAGIPEAGLVTMLIVLNAVGLPLEYIGLILSVDWLLDRFRTAVNVFGDATGAAVIQGTIPDPDPIPGAEPAPSSDTEAAPETKTATDSESKDA